MPTLQRRRGCSDTNLRLPSKREFGASSIGTGTRLPLSDRMQGRHILHVFPAFCPGGAQVRFVRLANAFGPDIRYTVLAMDGNFEAATLISPSIRVDLVAPPIRSLPQSAIWIRRLIRRIRPDLVITNNWGSMDAVLASWLAGVCPTIHSEDGFGSDEATRLKPRRVVTRRALLNRIHTTVVPSKTLLRIAREQYRVSESKATYIPNGIDVSQFQPRRCMETRRSLGASDDTTVIGFIGHLRPEKTVDVLIESFAQAKLQNALLLLVGDGPCRQDLESLAERLGIRGQIRFVGHAADPHPYLAALDVFAMSSATEQMPLSILEAMAYGLPVISTDVGDCADMLGTREFPTVVARADVGTYAAGLSLLASRPDLRRTLGATNRERCVAAYSFEKMAESYRMLYLQPLSDSSVPATGIRQLESD